MAEERMFSLALRKATREFAWSIFIIGVLSAGLTAWIVVLSISASLESSIGDYGSRVATYIIISPKGEVQLGMTSRALLPQNVVERMKAVEGVANIYPMSTNRTGLVYFNITATLIINGEQKNHTFPEFTTGINSAVLGQKGFPLDLVDLVKGRLPDEGEAGFIWNANLLNFKTRKAYQVNDTVVVDIAGVRFNATLLGINAFNPMLREAGVLWDSAFLRQKLGAERYEATFGGRETNFVIVKARSVEDVSNVVDQLRKVLEDYPRFLPTFDELTVRNLQSFRAQTAPLYQLLGFVSLASTATVTFLVAYLGGQRRGWEGGLLISQGWSWGQVATLFLWYYILLAGVAYALSASLSFIVSSYTTFRYEAWGTELVVSVVPYTTYLWSALPLVLLISAAAASMMVWRWKKTGLDRLLREH